MNETANIKQTVISAENISIGYRKSTYGNDSVLFSNLSLKLYSGELTCLLGQNGAGKSTLLRTLSSNQEVLSGNIFLFDKNLKNYSETDLSYNIGLVLTDKTSIGGFRVSELVGLGRYPYTGFWGRLSRQDKEIVNKAMKDVGIAPKANRYIAELSDGERQKVMIAKALAQECPIVFLDEPTAFLDVTSRIEIMDLLHNLAVKQGKAILLSTHDIELALLLADRLWLLSGKDGLKCGVTEDIVLSRSIESFLSHNDIAFNMESGNFYPKKEFSRFAYIEASTQNYRWFKNFLERNSWGIAADESKALFSIRQTAIDVIEVKKDGEMINFVSFEDFHFWLIRQ